MEELATPNAKQKKNWMLTGAAFQQLLVWLDDGVDSNGETYLKIRRRLVAYFDRKNCPSPDDMADETLNRVARRIEEESAIVTDTPAHYCYIVARFVFLESLRASEHEQTSLDEIPYKPSENAFATFESGDERERHEKMLNCLERCAAKLETENCELIIGYYSGEQRIKIENRRALAAKLNITMNALSIRACRIRDKLETCVKQCADAG